MSQQLKTEANSLTSQIVTFLNDMGHFAWRLNTMGVYDQNAGRYRKNNSINGVTDVLCVLNITGRSLFVEIKIGKDRMKIDQEIFRDEVVKRGAIHWVINDINQFTETYREFHAKYYTTKN